MSRELFKKNEKKMVRKVRRVRKVRQARKSGFPYVSLPAERGMGYVERLAHRPADDPYRYGDQQQDQDGGHVKRGPHILAHEHHPAGNERGDHAADVMGGAAVAEDRSPLALRRGVGQQFHEHRTRSAEYEKHHSPTDPEHPEIGCRCLKEQGNTGDNHDRDQRISGMNQIAV